jgi:glycosyltransferase involved in cell wall biosynthesis
MKLCIFSENYQRGGIDTFLCALINAWPDEIDELTLFVNSENPFESQIEKRITRSAKIVRYENRITRKSSQLVMQSSNSQPKFFELLKNRVMEVTSIIQFPYLIIKIYKQLKPLDINALLVVNGGYPGGINCRASAVAGRILVKKNNVVFSFHNYAVKSRLVRRILEAPIDCLVSISSKIIVSVSTSCLSSLDNRYFLRSNPNRKVIFNGIEDPQSLVSENYVSNSQKNRIYCVVIGAIEPRKGHYFLLDAFKYVVKSNPDVILLIVGKGSTQNENNISTRIRQLGLEKNVELLGYIEDVRGLIRNSSLLLVPSQSYESFGITIVEAMALKVPVVATDVGGIPEVLDSNIGGIICPRDDPKIFGLAILQFLENREFADIVAREGRLRFEEKFTSKEMATHYRDTLKLDTHADNQ